ncbi:MAG: hypothetical protein LBR09_01795 [Endomicrobium sp.]|jgi:hypothetical protein|nr:hypothetical protein [Endomicrobium sp.]
MWKFEIPKIVICKGKSEENYIQELNKYFRNNDINNNFNFIPKSVGSGHFDKVRKKYRKEYKKNRKSKFIIWVDKDIYVRNSKREERKNAKEYEEHLKSKNPPDFYFNEFNFEDFLILHCPKYIVLQWQKVCIKNNHFDKPMIKDKYLEVFKDFWGKTEIESEDEPIWEMVRKMVKDVKCPLLADFISEKSLNRLFKNNKDEEIKFKSGFADIIYETIHPPPQK